MCGIAGMLGLGAGEGRARIGPMLAAIEHRGPDDSGVWAEDGVALGMRRLSIIDLAGGHQPMRGDSGTVIVFNGEIYNHNELRAELAAQGRVFRTRSDTEVVLQGFEAWGPSVVDRLRGMFAICLFDPRERKLHLMRDRLGKKPLYWAKIGSRFYFASEIKAILAALESRPDIDRQALHHYLTFRFVPAPLTIWQGVRKLMPGTRLAVSLDGGEPEIGSYWELAFRSESVEPGRDYGREFADLLVDAVRCRLEAADVPVGVLLSGGLDSATISAVAVELGHRRFHTFSVGFADGGAYSELGFARQMAEHVGSNHHEVVIDRDDFVATLPDIVRITDEPLADLAAVPLHHVCRLARSEVKVVLSGEGSDEMLGGYDLEQLGARIERLRRWGGPLPRALWQAVGAMSGGRLDAVASAMAKGGWSGYLRERGAHMTDVWDEASKARLYNVRPDGLASSDALLRDLYLATRSPQPIDQYMEVHARQWLVEDLLMKADKVSMASSLELRCPFLDHRLVEFCERLPLSWKIGSTADGWTSKRILRAFAAERLPQSILTRPKQGFPVPAHSWLTGPLRSWAEDFLARPRLAALFDGGVLRQTMARAAAGDTAASHRIWSIIVLGHWLDAWA